jgi:hypothetical protein
MLLSGDKSRTFFNLLSVLYMWQYSSLHNLNQQSGQQLKQYMMMTVFWDVALCSLADIDHCFRGTLCLRHLGT